MSHYRVMYLIRMECLNVFLSGGGGGKLGLLNDNDKEIILKNLQILKYSSWFTFLRTLNIFHHSFRVTKRLDLSPLYNNILCHVILLPIITCGKKKWITRSFTEKYFRDKRCICIYYWARDIILQNVCLMIITCVWSYVVFKERSVLTWKW